MEWIQPLRVASAMTKSGRMRFAFSALRWKLPKSWPTMGSSQTRCRLGSPIMLLSQVLPLRPEPDQELPGFLFVDLPVALVEQVFPVAGHAFAIEGGRVFLAPLAPLGEILKAGRVHAALHQPLVCVNPEEA